MTRAIYAQMAWVSFAPQGMSQTFFYSRVLGHQENSLTTSLSYQKFAIRRDLKEDPPNLVSKITSLEANLDHKFQDLEQKFDKINVRLEQETGESAEVTDNKVDVKKVTFRAKDLKVQLKIVKAPRKLKGPDAQE